MVPDSKPSPARSKSPLPPRPPSSNPLKRKLSMETVPEDSLGYLIRAYEKGLMIAVNTIYFQGQDP
ncbi:Kinesin-like protein KIN12B [Cucumis melo var. makuwa]|uniref:Kinesin-like protein KIN12B n=1 Tax=Cucumis melo var. makuwa TaxID=1194695 RepID=A0A5A7V9H7_CUCMM|nr:Kinesin-like protein KIN12B [Cucumis melo var. makuwa]